MLFTAYAIVRTVPSANRPNRREKKSVQRLWSSSTCVGVRLLFCGTCGLTTSLPPLIKSQPVGCVHKGGASSTPMSDTASGCRPLLSHCWSWCPRPTLLPWKACRIGGRLYPIVNSLLWNNLSPGRQRIGKSAGKTDIGESAPCSKMGRAQVRNGGVRSTKSGLRYRPSPWRGHSPCSGMGKAMVPAHSPSIAHACVQSSGVLALPLGTFGLPVQGHAKKAKTTQKHGPPQAPGAPWGGTLSTPYADGQPRTGGSTHRVTRRL